MELQRRAIATPLGPMLALASETALCALEFTDPSRVSRLDRRLARWYGGARIVDAAAPNGVLRRTEEWLDAYFAGAAPDAAPPLDMRGAPFELRVWRQLLAVPPGATATYGEIARRIGSPGASRAVGLANGANPVAIIVPCHRVVGAGGALTGYGGGLDRKQWLLTHEARWRKDAPPAPGRLPLDG